MTAIVPPSRVRGYGTAWWGMAMLILTESMVFGILLASYFFLRASAKEWPLGGIELPDLRLSIPFSVVLWSSSIPALWAEAGIRRGRQGQLRAGLLLSFLMGAAFIGYTVKDFNDLHFGWQDNAYGSIFYTLVGLHALHVVIGLAMNLAVQAKAWAGKFSATRHQTVAVYSLYWHFVDVVWLFVFPSLFLSPHIR
jgi:heme/copper-type cytochrome/quinol oxidase subunit 3